MKHARISLAVLGLVFVMAGPATAQEAWRHHVVSFTTKLFTHIFFTHSQRDYIWAKKLAAADHVVLDDDVMFAAAYLHDVGAWQGWNVTNQEHGDTSAAKLDQMLAGTDFPKDKMDRARDAMRTHMFYREPGPSPEARYLHDADALDNVGTIGIAWVLENVDPKGGDPTGPQSIEQIRKAAPAIESRVVTPAGKAEMATRIVERKAFMDALARETDDFKAF